MSHEPVRNASDGAKRLCSTSTKAHTRGGEFTYEAASGCKYVSLVCLLCLARSSSSPSSPTRLRYSMDDSVSKQSSQHERIPDQVTGERIE